MCQKNACAPGQVASVCPWSLEATRLTLTPPVERRRTANGVDEEDDVDDEDDEAENLEQLIQVNDNAEPIGHSIDNGGVASGSEPEFELRDVDESINGNSFTALVSRNNDNGLLEAQLAAVPRTSVHLPPVVWAPTASRHKQFPPSFRAAVQYILWMTRFAM